ncbi:MAG: hypothetical protein V7K48_19485 [Nostoc sp.]|uniref:hypothetical protein n=1 Tax=Nostoc sp. TaxID=1180 RepID=UPI002FF80E2E
MLIAIRKPLYTTTNFLDLITDVTRALMVFVTIVVLILLPPLEVNPESGCVVSTAR